MSFGSSRGGSRASAICAALRKPENSARLLVGTTPSRSGQPPDSGATLPAASLTTHAYPPLACRLPLPVHEPSVHTTIAPTGTSIGGTGFDVTVANLGRVLGAFGILITF